MSKQLPNQTEEEGALGKGRGRTPPAEEERWAWKRVGVFRGDKKSGLERREAGGTVTAGLWRTALNKEVNCGSASQKMLILCLEEQIHFFL